MIWKTYFSKGACIYFDKKTVVKINDDIELTLVPGKVCFGTYQKKFCIENVKGDFEYLNISISSNRGCGKFIKDHRVFLCTPSRNEKHYIYCYITVAQNIQYNKTSYDCVPHTMEITSSRLKFLKIHDYNEGSIELSNYSMLKFKYFIKKLDFKNCEIIVENPYEELIINGAAGDFICRLEICNNHKLDLLFEFDPIVIENYFKNSKRHSIKTTESETEKRELPYSEAYMHLMNPECSPIILVSSYGVEITCHSGILSRFSKIFAKKFYNRTRFEFEEFDATTIQSALKFCFESPIDLSKCTPKMFQFVRKFEISLLPKSCSTIMEELLSIGNVGEIVGIAYLNNFQELKEKCHQLLSQLKFMIKL